MQHHENHAGIKHFGYVFLFFIKSLHVIQKETPTEHGLQFDKAADEVIKIDDLVLSVSGYKNLVESVIELKACKERVQDGLSEPRSDTNLQYIYI